MLNPFRNLDRPKEVWAWSMYDLANQSFTLLIITLLFSLYVQGVVTIQPAETATAEVIEAAKRQGTFNWSLIHGGSLLLVVALSPVLGAIADGRGWRKQFLITTGILCSLLTCALGFVGPGMIVLAAALYIPANLCYQLGENFVASFLPLISTPRNIGRISAIGWTAGYVGALILLILTMIAMLAFGLEEPRTWRPLFVFAGVWFALGIIPAMRYLQDDPAEGSELSGFQRLRQTLDHASQYRQLVRFLLAFLVYSFGVQVIVGFAAIIAADFGFEQVDLIIFVAQITVVAGLAAAFTSSFQDRIGARPTIFLYLAIWIVSASGLISVKLIWAESGPQWPLWLIGNGLGFALGGIGTASRSLVGRFTPRHRSAEFFGLWGMTYKLSGAVGVLTFGAVAQAFGQLASLILLLCFFVGGLLLLLRVNETAGLRAARRAERLALARR